jgi:hypothetical protein
LWGAEGSQLIAAESNVELLELVRDVAEDTVAGNSVAGNSVAGNSEVRTADPTWLFDGEEWIFSHRVVSQTFMISMDGTSVKVAIDSGNPRRVVNQVFNLIGSSRIIVAVAVSAGFSLTF